METTESTELSIIDDPIFDKLNKVYTILIENKIDIYILNEKGFEQNKPENIDFNKLKNDSYNLVKDMITEEEFNNIFNYEHIDVYYGMYIYYNYLKNNIDQIKKYNNYTLLNHFMFFDFYHPLSTDQPNNEIIINYIKYQSENDSNNMIELFVNYLNQNDKVSIMKKLEEYYNKK